MKGAMTLFLLALLLQGCSHRSTRPASSVPSGAALTEVSGGKQIGAAGTELDQPIVVQLNDKQGTAVAGAPITMLGAPGVVFTPVSGVTDASGQFTATVRLGETSGRYVLTAATYDAQGAAINLKLDEVALGWQQSRGRDLAHTYCDRCHDAESTAERVSNHDNLDVKPHAFNEGDYLNRLSDADLTNIITHGGPALGRSAEMPPYGSTLSKADLEAVVSYVRAVADPPFRNPGVVYAQK